MTILSEDELLAEVYQRLAEEGWEREIGQPLTSIVSDAKTFARGSVAMKLQAHGESIALQMTDAGTPVMAVNGLDPRRLNALLDVMGILPSSDEWMAWYRESIWEGTIAPS